ncbi:MAG: DUF308 domain-containing protein [Eggerthellaceae bacterium]|jgi:uncharacterized membrane protein HdeD (DUF308 family)|nr:DUF308 domain-containing protein [Eggerthellaceae bacterium]MCH4221033.1 DUF308 domain-containing protein [Eggerthellaceae bacterium]
MEKTKDWTLIIGGIILLLCGLICVAYPGLTLVMIALITGAGFVATGVLNFVMWLRTRSVYKVSVWSLIYAIINIIFGLVFLIHPMVLANVIPWLCGIFITALGLFELFTVMKMRDDGFPQWGWMIASAIVSLIIGIFFIITPEILPIFIGAFALIQGVTLVIYGFSVGKWELR